MSAVFSMPVTDFMIDKIGGGGVFVVCCWWGGQKIGESQLCID